MVVSTPTPPEAAFQLKAWPVPFREKLNVRINIAQSGFLALAIRASVYIDSKAIQEQLLRVAQDVHVRKGHS